MALSESRKIKLHLLLRSISRGDSGTLQEALGAKRLRGRRGESALTGGAVGLQEACGGAERTIVGSGMLLRYWLVRRRLDEFAGLGSGLAGRYASILRGAGERFDELEASSALCRAAGLRPEGLLFLDIETCGFSGAAIFLIGLMSCVDGELFFEQHLARNYAEERAILQAFARRLGEAALLVSFNGKAFDMTMIRERSAFHGIELPSPDGRHLDLLHESRRLWRRRLPNCRLQTLEGWLCGRHRTGDIPGPAIPEAYHDFVRTSDARRLRAILHHNRMDLLTMVELLCAILTGCEPAVQ